MKDPFGPVRRNHVRRSERARRAWYDFRRHGPCDVCGRYGRLTAHHVVQEQVVRRVAPDRVWDVANRLLLGWSCCHVKHHHPGVKDTRIAFEELPERAVEFGREILGDGPAAIYFARNYRAPEPPTTTGGHNATEPIGCGPRP